MWNFLKFIILVLFVISFILLKTIPKDNKIYSKIKIFFYISAELFKILIMIHVMFFIMDIIGYMFFESIKEFFKSFKGMP